MPTRARAGRGRRQRRRPRAVEDVRRARLAQPDGARRRRRHGDDRGRAGHHARGARPGGRPDPVPRHDEPVRADPARLRRRRAAHVVARRRVRRHDRHGRLRRRRRAGPARRRRLGARRHRAPRRRRRPGRRARRGRRHRRGRGRLRGPVGFGGVDADAHVRRVVPPRRGAGGRRAGGRRPGVHGAGRRRRRRAGPAGGHRRPGRRDGRSVPAGARDRAGARQGAEAVRRADRLVPGRQAHGGRHVRRHRAGPGAVPLRRAHPGRGRRPADPGGVAGQGGRRRLPAPGGQARGPALRRAGLHVGERPADLHAAGQGRRAAAGLDRRTPGHGGPAGPRRRCVPTEAA